jgi:hypothetical protein
MRNKYIVNGTRWYKIVLNIYILPTHSTGLFYLTIVPTRL